MSVIQVFDPALCCASGVCGTEVEQRLVSFAADVAWVRSQGVAIERFNLAQQPMQFAETPAVSAFLTHAGEEGLPLVLVDGQVVLTGRYPSRAELARYAGLPAPQAAIKGIVKSGCCSGSSGCC
ncbi:MULTISPECIES: arsenite efflux transporter metallochaperone ArsD [Aeromonas]|uniref:Arsenic resistance operon repressor n=1 Tax=Aeromonas caviae TaxID=648 RepID=A0AAV4YIH6_AERCA|nr:MULTISPECIES: arsenite efflux transporter metallochaperone ArsD [Aeromonas]MEB6605165.1 arsenite efflux transporter metallochaperone ArsD [Aeromonas sanarellii]BCM76796.1 arsenic resistance operon repressor [Aeromonas caviae]GJA30808.1 arsenic resistance operon repressor [Aeromonas caviae]GJA35284.1 arsenic resistance operon repressor [Aeromonas caviae]GJA39931.1 arsenic resistance operon repressor [Aeromonas caviae]